MIKIFKVIFFPWVILQHFCVYKWAGWRKKLAYEDQEEKEDYLREKMDFWKKNIVKLDACDLLRVYLESIPSPKNPRPKPVKLFWKFCLDLT
ncbi:MAG TPA: hypothetical protein ENH26_01185 [Candidatus Wolfebacteria bacterium]|nr:hypothetical protein [Candidatus Wolfebacteria bacterium]